MTYENEILKKDEYGFLNFKGCISSYFIYPEDLNLHFYSSVVVDSEGGYDGDIEIEIPEECDIFKATLGWRSDDIRESKAIQELWSFLNYVYEMMRESYTESRYCILSGAYTENNKVYIRFSLIDQSKFLFEGETSEFTVEKFDINRFNNALVYDILFPFYLNDSNLYLDEEGNYPVLSFLMLAGYPLYLLPNMPNYKKKQIHFFGFGDMSDISLPEIESLASRRREGYRRYKTRTSDLKRTIGLYTLNGYRLDEYSEDTNNDDDGVFLKYKISNNEKQLEFTLQLDSEGNYVENFSETVIQVGEIDDKDKIPPHYLPYSDDGVEGWEYEETAYRKYKGEVFGEVALKVAEGSKIVLDASEAVLGIDLTNKMLELATEGKSIGVNTDGKSVGVDTTGSFIAVDTTGKKVGIDTTGSAVKLNTVGSSITVDTTGKTVGLSSDSVVKVDATGSAIDVNVDGKELGIKSENLSLTGTVKVEGGVVSLAEGSSVEMKYSEQAENALKAQGDFALAENERRALEHENNKKAFEKEYGEGGVRDVEKSTNLLKQEVEYSSKILEEFEDSEGNIHVIYQGSKRNHSGKVKREIEQYVQQRNQNLDDIEEAKEEVEERDNKELKKEIETNGVGGFVFPEELNDYEVHKSIADAYYSDNEEEEVDIDLKE